MKGKFIFITFLVMLAIVFTYLSLPKEEKVTEIIKEVKLDIK